MQTFLPYSSFRDTARVLDNKRLGKQRVETYQILKALTGQTKGWVNHPATVMWRDHEYYLCAYGIAMCNEWTYRGFKDSLHSIFLDYSHQFQHTRPWWLDFAPLHTSHQSNLYRKDAEHYADFASVGADLPYVWCHADGTYHLGTDKTIYPAQIKEAS